MTDNLSMESAIKKPIKKAAASVARAMTAVHLLPKRIIIRMDGGICSQMHFYLVGKMLENRGFRVSYDLDWYEIEGMDLDGRFARNFDLLKLQPNLQLEVAERPLLTIYKSLFYRYNDYFAPEQMALKWLETTPPVYLDGYFRDPEEMFTKLFRTLFRANSDVLDAPNLEILKDIVQQRAAGTTCAVHVRRGDLSKYVAAYGAPAKASYFIDSFREVTKAAGGRKVRFYIFSDEPQWFKDKLAGLLKDYDVKVVDINGSDKGYMDLVLMSKCRHQITSRGSMGKYAALLRSESNRDGLVTLAAGEGADEWRNRFENTRVICE